MDDSISSPFSFNSLTISLTEDREALGAITELKSFDEMSSEIVCLHKTPISIPVINSFPFSLSFDYNA